MRRASGSESEFVALGRGSDAAVRAMGTSMDESLLRLVRDFSREHLDDLPFGAVVIDRSGTILEYNEYETRLSHLERAKVLGKNFFRDVAPCTGVQAFEGRMRAFLKTKDSVSESFSYHFPFRHGAVEVRITFVRLPEKGRILIAVERIEPDAP
jgi:photoactive yellow protein